MKSGSWFECEKCFLQEQIALADDNMKVLENPCPVCGGRFRKASSKVYSNYLEDFLKENRKKD